ncbi:hypothetical protein [Thiosulfativibrio zosterae]|uniref:Lipoprotein n=1 Tax=Thiosulfativibrio zosterae TaxID=2675053 RepID=A0A6F8PK90_9GAMM|nr:hypothetical protein [Thiosulfativibrio zosterae]BBP42521.1 hypothetical protein THMIRHAT_02670 [Thiosulfativibrio zosterae]
MNHLIKLGLLGCLLALSGCQEKTPEKVTQWPLQKTCDLHHNTCLAEVKDAKVSLTINPQPIPIARPLGITVMIDGLAAQQVELDISGVNMYMGYNRIPLTSTKPGRFVGTSMLAFCTTDKMEWQVTVMIQQPNGEQVQVPFLLETQNN